MSENHTDDKKYTPEEAEQKRTEAIEKCAVPYVEAIFKEEPTFNSAYMLVAQYWNDEADDAVHDRFLFSKLEKPDLEAAFKSIEFERDDDSDQVNLDGRSHEDIECEYYKLADSASWWDENDSAIPLFAAFCKEDCHQEMECGEAYTPIVLFQRNEDNSVKWTFIGEKLRPWLDGVRPQWELEQGANNSQNGTDASAMRDKHSGCLALLATLPILLSALIYICLT